MTDTPTIHASAVLVGGKAALIRGPAGAGKSRLAFELIEAATRGALPFARLVADDRAHVEARAGRLLVRPAPALAGLIEVHGLGIRRLPHEPLAVAGLVVDLAETVIEGVSLPRLAVAPGMPALPLVLAFLSAPAAAN
jgi:serine kinase of HPr protein (carbohydrate metabolism regulator)